LEFKHEFAQMTKTLGASHDNTRWLRKKVLDVLQAQRVQLSSPRHLEQREGIPPAPRRALEDTINLLRQTSDNLLKALEDEVEHFKHSEENEDRFLVVVFGEVKAGKSALANHMAGLEFDLPPEQRGECFVEEKIVQRLLEKPTECTKDLQGFRLPGLLWIDCPGVLSGTAANTALARRLVVRADFILLATSSDAPFRKSEIKELVGMIRDSGNQELEGCMVVTKSDFMKPDEDDLPVLFPKSDADRQKQIQWGREQLASTGMEEVLSNVDPLTVSAYIARHQLGRNWLTGAPLHCPPSNWRTGYDASGIPELCRFMAKLVREHGLRLKRLWPQKRCQAIRYKLQSESAQALQRLQHLLEEIGKQRQQLNEASQRAADDAAEFAAARVSPCLNRCRIHQLDRFDRSGALKMLQRQLLGAVEHAVGKEAGKVLNRTFRGLDSAVQGFVTDTEFNLDVRKKTQKTIYKTTTRPRAVGQAVGGTGGTFGGGMLGTLLLGPGLGTILGSLVGGCLGGIAGGEIVPLLWVEEQTAEVVVGTNAADIIRQTEQAMRDQATCAVNNAFRQLEGTIFVPLEEEIGKLEAQVKGWPLALEG